MFIPEFVVIGLGLFFGWIVLTGLLSRAGQKNWIKVQTSGVLIVIETCLFTAAAGYFIGQGTCG